jgi:glycine oxidase
MAADILIIGAGVIGSSLACELTRERFKVLVLDRKQPAAEATWAAAGMLAPVPEGPESTALVPLERASLDLYPEFVDRIEAASGIRTGFRRTGALVAFFGARADHEQGEFLAALSRFDLAGQPLTGDEARRREPTLSPAVAAAVWLPREASIDNRTLGRALAVAARRQGVELRCGVEATALLVEQDRCCGVLAAGERISAGHVVIAAGCFSARIEQLARYAPTRPVRGQMIALDAGAARPATVLRSERGYLVPREDGRLIAGSTLEDAGFDKSVTPQGLQSILAGAMELVPALAAVPILETWSGLRPDSPDHLPLLGPTDLPGLSIATGHYRNGILLAPITARLGRQWLTGKATDFDLAPFSPLRFGQSAAR